MRADDAARRGEVAVDVAERAEDTGGSEDPPYSVSGDPAYFVV
jgi:hypothetical protein